MRVSTAPGSRRHCRHGTPTEPLRRGRRPLRCAAGLTALAGCGAAGGPIGPSLRSLPLLPGARVVVSTRQCDSGANAFCALEAVVAQPRARNSQALVASERRLLSRLGWHPATADTKHEQAASSPGRKLRRDLCDSGR